jgi:DNA end-binding protein Ku
MRSIWKGHLRFSLVTIPVQVFNAIETGSSVSFRQLNKHTNNRVRYKKVDAITDDPVGKSDIVKGYEYEPDQYVVLTKEELKAVKLESTRTLEIEAFVDVDEVHPSRYEAVYFVGPNGEIGIPTFALLVTALKSSGRAAVGRIILRDREDVVLLCPQGDGIVMYKLRYPYEVRSMDDVPDLGAVEVDEAQLALAHTLIKSLSKPFEEVDFTDRYRDALLDLVNDKIEGKEIVTDSDADDAAPVVDIMVALKQSIEAAKKAG